MRPASCFSPGMAQEGVQSEFRNPLRWIRHPCSLRSPVVHGTSGTMGLPLVSLLPASLPRQRPPLLCQHDTVCAVRMVV